MASNLRERKKAEAERERLLSAIEQSGSPDHRRNGEPVGAAGRIVQQRRAGYVIMTANNGREAVAISEQRGDDIDLAVFDILMPEMSGREAYELIRKRRPGLRALRTSYVFGEDLTLLQKTNFAPDLLKPVRGILDKSSSHS